MAPKEIAKSNSASERMLNHIVTLLRTRFRKEYSSDAPNKESRQLCKECRRIGWIDLFLYGSDDSDDRDDKSLLKGTVADLIRRQPCAFCRLVLHLASAKDAQTVISLSTSELGTTFLQQPYEVVQTYAFLDRRFMFLNVYCGKASGATNIALKGRIVRIKPPLNPLRRSSIPKQLGTTQVNSQIVLSWIKACDAQHGLCRKYKKEAASRSLAMIRLIDVVEKRLVKAQAGFSYVALSYVWGKTDMFRTRRYDLTALEENSGLSSYWHRLGRTIQDAVLFVESLNGRYLWVDAICIVQDDAAEMRTQISQMDAIYSQAFLTLIALTATDAASDLPGVRPGSRSSTSAGEVVEGHVLAAQPSYRWDDLRSSSVYDTRAWAFQESILSPRCLFFAEKRVIFQCLQGVEVEHPLREEPKERPRPEHINPLVDLFASFEQGSQQLAGSAAITIDFMRSFYFYQILTIIYSNRNLTYPSDILNAFSGVMAMLERRGAGPFVYGLPEANLDLALLWTSGNPGRTSRWNFGGIPPQHNDKFPSWAWAGWSGPVRWDLFPPRGTNFTDETDGSPYILSTLKHLRIQDEKSIRPILKETSKLFTSNARAPPSKQINRSASYLAPSMPGILHFRTLAAPFSLFSVFTEEPTSGGPPLRFITFKDRVCGILHCPEPLPSLQTGNQGFEIIELSRIRDSVSNLFIMTQTGISKQTMKGYTWQEWSVANIMLIKYHGRFAERITIGQIHVDTLDEAKLKEKWIALA